ncbi:hypothetical protein [Cupriavidus basilensis]
MKGAMLKKTFTAAEAAAWLAARMAEPLINDVDIVREAAAGRLPVCFDYRGDVAVYARPSVSAGISWIFPKAISRHYFVGLLRSKSPVQLGARVESFSTRPGPAGQRIRCVSVDHVDILRPNHVEVVTSIHADPPLSTVDSSRFVARCDQHGTAQYTQIPKSEWVFHIDDLLALITSQVASVASPTVQGADESRKRSETAMHRIRTRAHALRAVIEAAKVNAAACDDYHSVWATLVLLAEGENRPAPLLGYVEGEGVKYQTDKGIKFFTKDALRKQMDPRAR